MKKRILVLGDTGFIGSNCIRRLLLDDRYDVYGASKSAKNITTYSNHHCNLLHNSEIAFTLTKIKPHIIIQAAAVTTGSKDVIERPYLHVTDNAIMNSLILRECVNLKELEHFIFFSCTVMYQPKTTPQKESDWNAADEIYPAYFGVGNTKVYIEKMLDFYSRISNFKCTAIRHSNVYGPGDKYDFDKCHMVPALIRKVYEINEKETRLEVWGTGKAQRDILYIDDLIDFVMKCVEKQQTKYELYNCGQGKYLSVQDIVQLISEIANKEISINWIFDKPDIPTTVVLDCQKAKEQLGWTPKTSVEDGLRKTYEWFASTQRERSAANV